MGFAEFAAALARLSPRLKTPVQLTGVIVAGVFFYLASISTPPNFLAQVTAGLIGVTVLAFGVVLNQLQHISQARRPGFVLRLYAIFGIIITIFLIVGAYFLLRQDSLGKRAQVEELRINIIAAQEKLNGKLASTLREQARLRQSLASAELSGLAVRQPLLNQLETVSTTIDDQRSELILIDQLLSDLDGPDSRLLGAIGAARALIQGSRESSPSFGISSAYAQNIEALKDQLQKQVEDTESSDVRTRIYLAWLRKVTGEVHGDTAVREALLIEAKYPEPPEPKEYVADCYVEIGDFQQARFYYAALVRTLEATHPTQPMRLSFALKNLATYTRLANGGSAGEDLMRRAENVYLNSGIRDPVIYANIENDFGGFHLARNDVHGAVARYESALKYYETDNASRFGYAYVLINLGKAYVLLADYKRALQYLDRAVKVQEQTTGLNTDMHAVTLQLKGDAFRAQHSCKEARLMYERELEILESRRIRSDLLTYVKAKISECDKLMSAVQPQTPAN